MSASGGNRAIIAALLANLGIATTKFIAFLLTRSSSMLAESIHSLADSGNQALLLVGGRRARQAPDQQHPFGAADVASTIDAAEARIRSAVPIAKYIYVEPDVDRAPVRPDSSPLYQVDQRCV